MQKQVQYTRTQRREDRIIGRGMNENGIKERREKRPGKECASMRLPLIARKGTNEKERGKPDICCSRRRKEGKSREIVCKKGKREREKERK